MSEKRFDLYVPISDDGRTTFSEVSDILEHLATLYAWHPDCYGFLVTRAHEARQIDTIYEVENSHTQSCRELRTEAERDGMKFNSGSDCLDPECPHAK